MAVHGAQLTLSSLGFAFEISPAAQACYAVSERCHACTCDWSCLFIRTRGWIDSLVEVAAAVKMAATHVPLLSDSAWWKMAMGVRAAYKREADALDSNSGAIACRWPRASVGVQNGVAKSGAKGCAHYLRCCGCCSRGLKIERGGIQVLHGSNSEWQNWLSETEGSAYSCT